jgi:phage-related tail fiber protein
MYAFNVRLFALALAIAIPLSAQQPRPEPFIVGEIRTFAFDPTVEPGKSVYAKLADQGWMECRGQELPYGPKNPYYRKIYEVLGISWGTTSSDHIHPTNFLVPDLRGEFLRGWDHGRGQDREASSRILPHGHQGEPTDKVGTSQNDKVRQDVGFTSAVHNSTRGFNQYSGNPGTGTIVELRGQSNEANLALAGNHVGPETVPHNVYVFYAIFVGTKVRPEHR